MADEKKPDFDPDKTIVDIRRPAGKPADEDRTIVSPASRPAPAAPPPSGDADRTMVMTPHAHRPPAVDDDRTIVGARPPGGGDAGDRTMVRGIGSGAAAAAAPDGFQIIALTGSSRGRRFPLSHDEVLIGSGASCQIEVAGAAPVHVKLVRQPDGFELQNQGPSGSVVLSGGRKPSRAKLKSGDLLKIGEDVFRFAQSGEIFSSDFEEKEFQGSLAGGLFAPENRLYLILGALVVVGLLVFFWPSGPQKQVVKKVDTSAEDKLRAEEVASLLQAGEVLFNAGSLTAPADQPDVDNAFSKFNEVLSLDPGNEKAREWLKRIDDEREKQKRAREEAEKKRLAEEEARRERQRQELEQKVAAIIAQGDEYYDKGQVTEPVGTNALAKYREALKVYPESSLAQERVARAANYYVERGDELRDKGDSWGALENYRKASRASQGREELVEKRVQDLEAQLRSGMAGTNVKLVIYKDEKGQLFVLDDADKVPAKYKDRAVEVNPAPPQKGGGGLR